jgi:CheY-like chemotaxis protein
MGSGETILVVEDEREVLDVIELMLTHLGFRVITSSNGAEALSLFEKHHDEIALVLTDMMMPGMTGADLFRAIRARDSDMKVIVLSGYPKEQIADSEAVRRVDGWLRKPPDLASLGRLLSGLLRADHSRRSGP